MSITKWKMENKKSLVDTSIFNLASFEIQNPRQDKRHLFYRLECPGWVSILPITPNKEVIVIAQFRAGIEDITLEIPGGIVEQGETPRSAAIRELEEETAYTTLPENIIDLGQVWPNPATQNNCCFLFAAENVEPKGTKNWDEMEEIEIIKIPYPSFIEKIKNGEIKHSIVLNTVIKYELMRKNTI